MSTVTNKSYVIAVDQHHHEKSRRFLRIILIIVGIIILLATLFLAVVVYRTLKTGATALFLFSSDLSIKLYSFWCILGVQKKSLTTFDSNNTELISNQSSLDTRSGRSKTRFSWSFSNDKFILACQYGTYWMWFWCHVYVWRWMSMYIQL